MKPFPTQFSNSLGKFWLTTWAESREQAERLAKIRAEINYRKGWGFIQVGDEK